MEDERTKAIEYSSDELLERMQEPLKKRKMAAREAEMMKLAKEKEADDVFESNLKFMDRVLTEKKQTTVDLEDEEFKSDEDFMDYVLNEKRNRR